MTMTDTLTCVLTLLVLMTVLLLSTCLCQRLLITVLAWEVLTEIVGFSTNGPVVATILPGKPRYVSGIPMGCHFIKYTVTDACGNYEVIYCPFRVEDQVSLSLYVMMT